MTAARRNGRDGSAESEFGLRGARKAAKEAESDAMIVARLLKTARAKNRGAENAVVVNARTRVDALVAEVRAVAAQARAAAQEATAVREDGPERLEFVSDA